MSCHHSGRVGGWYRQCLQKIVEHQRTVVLLVVGRVELDNRGPGGFGSQYQRNFFCVASSDK